MDQSTAQQKIHRVIGVVSGKGGVGKSTVTVLLAQALAARGRRVGIMDADITGPSIPRLTGLSSFRGENDGTRLLPLKTEQGIKVVSINFYVEDEATPVVWRGPLLSKAIEQFWQDSDWGELDYLIIDFPPGTGDIQITAFNQLPVDGLVVAATPQSLVSMIVSKAVRMAGLSDAPVLGIAETMASLRCPHCNQEIPLFESLNGKTIQDVLGLPLLGSLPWHESIAHAKELVWDRLDPAIRNTAESMAAAMELTLAAQPAKEAIHAQTGQ